MMVVVAMPTMMAALKLRDIRMDMMARQPKPIHTGPLRAEKILGVRTVLPCSETLDVPHLPVTAGALSL